MARRTQLKGLSNNFAQYCVSRNFDCEGYWVIGQLYAFAQKKGSNSIVLNVLGASVMPDSLNEQFRSALGLLLQLVQRNNDANQIPMSWLAKVEIELLFDADFEHEYHYWSSKSGGSPFICLAKITTDLEKSFHAKSGGNVWTHDAARESRRCVLNS